MAKNVHETMYEPIIHDDPTIQLEPPKYPEVKEAYKAQEASIWLPHEIVFDDSKDRHDWDNKLNNAERSFLTIILAFFANSDYIVNNNLKYNVIDRVVDPWISFFYDLQIAMENVHSMTYAKLIEYYITDVDKKKELFTAVKNTDSIKRKAEWCDKYINYVTGDEAKDFARHIVSFAAVEGIFFSASFSAIFWIKYYKGILPALTFSNELISRDESMHQRFACLIWKLLKNKIDDKEVIVIIRDAVEVEKAFVREAIPENLFGMNKELMCKNVEFAADRLLYDLIGRRIYNTPCPFPWMDMLSIENKTNFFERHVSSYSRDSVSSEKIKFRENF